MESRDPMKRVTVGFASGLGNCVYMLPAVKALYLLGYRITLFVETDFPTAQLWRRCLYADRVLEYPAAINGDLALCGQWQPPSWKAARNVRRFPLPAIHDCEWKSNVRLAGSMGWKGEAPDVSDWCRDLERSRHWDVGIAPGSKTGTWLRKRWPGMKDIAAHFINKGRSVAVFGLETDGIDLIPGERVDTKQIGDLPDALAGCRVMIGGDSGVTHLASSLGVPVVMVYTATSAVKAEPVCRPNRKIHPQIACYPCVSTPAWQRCASWRCREIDPSAVIAAAEGFLNG